MRVRLCKLLVVFVLFAVTAGMAATQQKPNIIMVLVDDLGWTDLGCYGSNFYETPHIDRLAAEGMRFTDAYASCTVCSPSRASIMTGQYPARLHITDWIAGHNRPNAKLKIPDWTKRLAPEISNVARVLKGAGYATASIGKWHLGNEECYPDKQGFDVNIGGYNRGQPPSYFSPYRIPTLVDGPDGEFLTDREAAEAVKFIRANRERPFFVYLPHYAVHTPLDSKPEVTKKYRAKRDPKARHKHAVYAGLIESVDDAMGSLLEVLDELKLAERTLVIFTSDNGGHGGITSNAPLRAAKGSAYEGGVRVPMIARWAGVIKAGSVCSTPVIGADFYPTFLEVAKVKAPESHVVDGASIVPLLKNEGKEWAREALYWHYPHYHPGGATPYGAIREGSYRLVEFYEDERVELYNLESDLGEEKNLATEMPEKAAGLRKKLRDWRREVGAQMPTPK